AGVGLIAADVATYRELSSYLLGQVDSTLNSVHVGIESLIFEEPGGPLPASAVPGDCLQVRRMDNVVLASGCFAEFRGGEQPRTPSLPEHVALPGLPNPQEGDRVSFFTVPAKSGGGRYRVRASEEAQHPGYVLLIAEPLSSVDSTLHRLFLIEVLVTV